MTFTSGHPWFDVTGFGAAGNGSADDTPAIQAALTAAQAQGGVVYFPATGSSYYVTGHSPTAHRNLSSWPGT